MKKSILILLSLMALLPSVVIAQNNNREFIRKSIEKYGECRNVAITNTNGDLMLYGQNGYAAENCPDDLTNALDELNDKDEFIDDVQLTEKGHWLILYGDNGFRWSHIPKSLENKLREYQKNNEVVLSVTFNDDGDWVVITRQHFSASSDDISDWLEEGMKKHGMIWAVCITQNAMVAVFENGYKISDEVPEGLEAALRKTKLDVVRLKIAGQSWFFADKDGKYEYDM